MCVQELNNDGARILLFNALSCCKKLKKLSFSASRSNHSVIFLNKHDAQKLYSLMMSSCIKILKLPLVSLTTSMDFRIFKAAALVYTGPRRLKGLVISPDKFRGEFDLSLILLDQCRLTYLEINLVRHKDSFDLIENILKSQVRLKIIILKFSIH